MIRLCDNPPAMHGGDNCPSNSSYTESTNANGIKEQEVLVPCNEQPCQGKTMVLNSAFISLIHQDYKLFFFFQISSLSFSF